MYGGYIPVSYTHLHYTALIHRETEQETNDLSKAFRYCLKRGWKKLFILGATGKREDHTMGNISLLSDYQAQADAVSYTHLDVYKRQILSSASS